MRILARLRTWIAVKRRRTPLSDPRNEPRFEPLPSETYDAATGYALLAGTQLPPVDVTPRDQEDES